MMPAVASRGTAPRLALLLAGSGFCALVYQAMWLRELRSVFGASTPATAAVLAVFMAGLGAGGVLFGARAERSSRPLRLYAMLELGIAAGAALSPFLVDVARAAYYGLGGSSSLSAPGALVVRLLLTAVALGLPVVLMGGTFPAMARAIALSGARAHVDGIDVESRRPLALLYGANTLGSVAGALAATFVLLEVYGVRNSVWLACTLNALVATIALFIARRTPAAALPSSPSSTTSAPAATSATSATSAPSAPSAPASPASAAFVSRRGAVLAAAFATGLVFLLLELVWYRLCAPLLGGSTYSFGLVLAIALFGVGAGGLAYAFFGPARPTPGRFAVTCALQASLLLVPFAIGDHLALLAFHLRAMGEPTFLGLVLSWTAVTAILVLPGALVAGWQFPLLLGLAGEGGEGAARDSGHVYAANTLGSITGSIAGGFGALPLLGALGAWQVSAFILLVAGAAFFARAAQQERGRALAFVVLALCAVWLASFTGPTAMWRHNAIGAGRANLQAATWNDREALRRANGRPILEEHEGVESSLAFTGGHGESLMVNGKSDGSTLGDAQTQVGLGIVPALIYATTPASAPQGAPAGRRSARSAFVIGLGTGQTAGWLAAIPGMERVDVAEIEPRVIDFARRNADTNFDVVNAKNVRLIVADGREALATSPERYDLIVSEPSNPYRAGIASFYSLDFYRAARERLAEGGVFAQWLQAYEIEAGSVQTAVATMLQVFPHALALRLEPGDLLIIARDKDAPIEIAQLRALLEVEPYRTAMTRILFNPSAEGFLSRVYANDAFLHRLAAGATAFNTDDLPLLEVAFARSVGKDQPSILEEMYSLAAARGEHRLPIVDDATTPIDWQLARAQRGRFLIADGGIVSAAGLDPLEAAWAQLSVNAALVAADAAAPPASAGDVVGRAIRASARAQLPAADAGGDADELERAALGAAGFATEVAFMRLDEAVARGELARTPALLDAALSLLAKDPWVNTAFASGALQRLAGADLAKQGPEGSATALALAERLLVGPFAGRHTEHGRIRVAQALLRARGQAPMPAWCGQVFLPFEPNPMWTATWLDERLACYRAHLPDRVAAAEADLDAFVEHSAVPLASVLPPG